MKRQEKILFSIIILLAVIFSSGKEVYSNYTIQPNGSELTTGANSEGNNVISDVDYFDDEHLNQLSEFITDVDLLHLIPNPQNCILNLMCPTPIWQPPKNQ